MRCPATMPGSTSNVELRDLADPHLAPDDAPQVRRRRVQRVGRVVGERLVASAADGRAERRVVDLGVREVAAHLDAGERHQLEPRVATCRSSSSASTSSITSLTRAVRG